MDLKKYENPVTNQDNIKRLQELLVQTCIDYIKENNLTDIYEVNFSIDGLEGNAIEYGEWTPAMDSHISVVGLQQEGDKTITLKNGKTFEFRVRKLIGEYC